MQWPNTFFIGYSITDTVIFHPGECQNRRISDSWEQTNKKKVDLVIVKPEGSGFSSEENAKLFKTYIHGLKHSLKKQLGVIDLRLGFVTYGGEGRLFDPLPVTING